jgi:ankyrin repeat protein
VKATAERTQIELEARDCRGRTPLHWAADNGHLPVVQYLCEQGVDKEVRDEDGRTPLDRAVDLGQKAVVEFLRGRL